MRILFLLGIIISAYSANGSNYYINPSSDSAAELGTKENPWKSLGRVNENMTLFKGGDTILFKRGELYFGFLDIKCSGMPDAPVVFMTYGTAATMPAFLYQRADSALTTEAIAIRIYKCNHVILDGLEVSDNNLDPLDHTTPAHIKIGFAIEESNYITIRNAKVSLVGIGVNMIGNNNLVDKCKFENLRMVRNTEGGDDDYGANPVVIAGQDNIISNCFFKDCWANSFDYLYDGGAIEIFGANTNNNKIINNTAINCNGFMEFGSNNGGSSNNNFVANNTIVNCGSLVYVNNKGNFSISVENLFLFNNKILETVTQLTAPKYMISMTAPSTGNVIIKLENNCFWLTTNIDVARAGLFADGQLVHRNNTYYLSEGSLNYSIDPSESLFVKE